MRRAARLRGRCLLLVDLVPERPILQPPQLARDLRTEERPGEWVQRRRGLCQRQLQRCLSRDAHADADELADADEYTQARRSVHE